MKFNDCRIRCFILHLMLGVCVVLAADNSSSLGEWGAWNSCSRSCGGGIQWRNGTCVDCLESRSCNASVCADSASLTWVVIGVSVTLVTMLLICLVGIFFLKPASERKISRKRSLELLDSTPGTSRRVRACTVDSNVDFKLSTLRTTMVDKQQN